MKLSKEERDELRNLLGRAAWHLAQSWELTTAIEGIVGQDLGTRNIENFAFDANTDEEAVDASEVDVDTFLEDLDDFPEVEYP